MQINLVCKILKDRKSKLCNYVKYINATEKTFNIGPGGVLVIMIKKFCSNP